MKYLALLLALFMSAGVLFGQKERGGAGRDGGSRSTQDERRSEALQQNNDPRFAPFRDVISRSLGKTVRQVAAEYDTTVNRGLRYTPDQFITLNVAAKGTKIDPSVLAAKAWSPAPVKGAAAAARLSPTQDEFRQNLRASLITLTGKSEEDAQKIVDDSVQAASRH